MTKTQPLEVVAKLPPGVDLPTPAVQGEFRKLATDCFNAVNKALGVYRQLVAFIREHQLHPYFVRQVLSERGYLRQNIAGMIKAADAPTVDYERYQKGEIGFRAVLQKASRDAAGKKQKQLKLPGTSTPPRDKLRHELIVLLESYAPVVGSLPSFLALTVKFSANGFPCELKIGKKRS